MNEESQSPMLWILAGCAGFLVLGLCMTAGAGVYFFTQQPVISPIARPDPPSYEPTPSLPGPAAASKSYRVSATVVSNTDSKPAVGERCSFTVDEIADPGQPSGYWCHTSVRCGGRSIYGGTTNGYFPCVITPRSGNGRAQITGQDGDTTSTDTDPSFELNTVAGTLVIKDDSTGALGKFAIVAKIDDVR